MSEIKLVYNHIPRITAEMERQAGMVVRKTAMDIEAHAKASMSGPKHGRIYRRGKRMHQASAPGEPPAVDTGNLKNSIYTKMIKPTHAQVIAGANYAQILEMRRQRKFFEPAVEWERESFVSAMQLVLGRAK